MLGLRFALGWVHAATGQRGQAGCRGRGCVPHSPGWGLPPVLHEAGEALAGGTDSNFPIECLWAKQRR